MVHTTILAIPRLSVKRYAANILFRQSPAVAGRKRETKVLEPSSPLHALFLKRVREEMERLQVTAGRQLENRNQSGLPQRTISDTLGTQRDPMLLTVFRISNALGVQPWELLVEREEAERMKVSTPNTMGIIYLTSTVIKGIVHLSYPSIP